ncbi:tail fiber domain-containing protein [Kordia jejudonensis]|uniref:tail fiber domain-containing protein n=1 Tax=Kordia jejudonensis TaxID=1348245 RepID=UPI000629059C|nr:tail fiber domain-containing protein [Kordia jejudonensis]
MKKITFILISFFTAISFAQTPIPAPSPTPILLGFNQSFGSVSSSINFPIGQQFGTGEIFRFRPGLVTQLDSGSSFGFTNSRWFSIGRLNTGSQNVYGLRFQLPNRALTMGYQDINDTNPRLQWVGAGSSVGTDFEFRVANSFTSTNSTLVATMTNEGNTFFGSPLATSETKVGVDYSDVATNSRTGVTVENGKSESNYYTITGFKSINNVSCTIKTGMSIRSDGGSYGNTGVSVSLLDGYYNTGVSSSVRSQASGGSSNGVRGSVTGPSGVTPTGFGAGIYGSSAATTNRYAGYFAGNVVVTGSFSSGSDRKLKNDIKVEENMLEKLTQLDAVNYTFKPNDQLNLPSNLQHGFIAQNVEEVFPELVSTIKKPILDENNKELGIYEYKSVNYIGMISILTSSLKEMNEEMTLLKSELADLRYEAQSNEKSKVEDDEGTIDGGFLMEQNKPNPFTDQSVINYRLPSDTKASIAVVDLSGKFVKEYELANEKGQLIINSSDIGKGIFIYTLISGNEVIISKKMIIR